MGALPARGRGSKDHPPAPAGPPSRAGRSPQAVPAPRGSVGDAVKVLLGKASPQSPGGVSTRNPHGIPGASRSAPGAAPAGRAVVVGDLIGRVAEQAGIGRSPQLQKLEQAWRDAVGRATASQTRIQGLRAGVLTIEVSSSALAQELMVYYRRDLLARLREQAGAALVDLRFRVTGQPVPQEKSEGGA